jgi:hypothetical protein
MQDEMRGARTDARHGMVKASLSGSADNATFCLSDGPRTSLHRATGEVA